MTRTVAAIDCGTNSTRLLIARFDEPTGAPHDTIERRMTITRLGAGVDRTGQLDDAAIDRTIHCLVDYRLALDAYDVDSIRMVATSAARDASNRDELFAAAEAVIGIEPELLAGTEEAQLSFAGAVAELDPAQGPFLVVDIGGGSTEFAFGTDRCEASLSTDMGCVRLSEKYLLHDPPHPDELVAALSIAELHIDDVIAAIPDVITTRTLVGVAGTVAASAAIEQGLGTYDRSKIHHFLLSKAAAEDVFRTLATESRTERLANPGMEEGRVDVIVGGMVILVRVMRQLGFESCLVSESDILDGLVMSQR